MQRNELITQLETFLSANQQVADEAAPALKLLRAAYAELRKPASGDDTTAQRYLAELSTADRTINGLNDRLVEVEFFIYDLLGEMGMVPEVNDEPVASLSDAMEREPNLLEALKEAVSSFSTDDDTAKAKRFIFAVRNLLGTGDVSLEEVYAALESKAQYLAGLEGGIAERDKNVSELEALVSACLDAAGEDWQDVEGLPGVIKQMRQNAESEGVPLSGWVSDAIDLAHAVRGNLAPENRVMAKAAEALILKSPRGEA